jgi:hypothetical protein
MTDRRPGLSAHTVSSLLADTSPYLSCDDCFARLDEYVELRLQDARYEDPAMRAHLLGCGACADEANALAELLTQTAD